MAARNFGLTMEEELLAWVDEVRGRTSTSRSAFIRSALEAYRFLLGIARSGAQAEEAQATRELLDAGGPKA